jgi:hypothetical protein
MFSTIKHIYISLFFLTVTFCIGSTVGAQPAATEKEIISEGVGSTIPEAAQNAAQNALTNIVGSFIDSSKALEKKVQIEQGIRNETKTISTDIKEYSQGTIRKFEILQVTGGQGDLVRVQARIVVRIEDFRAYVNKLAEAEIKIDEGLFAQMKTEQKQNENIGALLFDKVLLPIVDGQAIRFSVGAPKPYSQSNIPEQLKLRFYSVLEKIDTSKTVVIPVEASLDKDFIENINKIFVSTAKDKYRTQLDSLTVDLSNMRQSSGSNWQSDVLLLINDELASNRQNLVFDVYRFSNARKILETRSPWSEALVTGQGTGQWNGKYETFHRSFPTPVKTLVVEFLDAAGSVLQRDEESFNSNGAINQIQGKGVRLYVLGYTSQVLEFSSPWSLVGMYTTGGGSASPVIRTKSNFLILSVLEDKTLVNAKSISVKLIN